MKTRTLKMMALLFIPALTLALTLGVARGQQEEDAGAIAVVATTATFTVQSVDAAKREVTLKAADGTEQTFKLGDEVRNFDQIQVGDQVKATVIDSLAVSARGAGEPPSAGESRSVALAPKGEKPGAVVSETEEITATIQDIDPEERTVTFLGPQGKLRTVKVGPDVDLSKLNEGDSVTLRYTKAMAIKVETP
jgi:Cu/Ag efflux protein CusF